jgi:hypothetical protein
MFPEVFQSSHQISLGNREGLNMKVRESSRFLVASFRKAVTPAALIRLLTAVYLSNEAPVSDQTPSHA